MDFDNHYKDKLISACIGRFDGIYSPRFQGKGKKRKIQAMDFIFYLNNSWSSKRQIKMGAVYTLFQVLQMRISITLLIWIWVFASVVSVVV